MYRRPVPDHLTETMLERAAKVPTESIDIIKGVFDFRKIRPVATSPEAAFVRPRVEIARCKLIQR